MGDFMSFRKFIKQLERNGSVQHIHKPVSKHLQVAGILNTLEPQPVLCHDIAESKFPVIGNLLCTKEIFAGNLGISVPEIIPTLTRAIEAPTPPQAIGRAPCQEVIHRRPDLDDLPILFHCDGDGGNYISSGVMIAGHPRYGQNMDFHRCMQFSKTEMAVRVVQGRNFDAFLQDLGQVDVAICIGVAPNILVAGATSVQIGVDELGIANALAPFQVVPARASNLLIPAEAEFVLEGTVYRDRRHAEGPFVDLTETQDTIRQEPVLVVKCITHREDAIWHALLPGGLEHKLLMGMPREPTIFREVNRVVQCLDVHINPGGSSWLHAIVQIRKRTPDDGLKAIHAAHQGHSSCKHIFVVDEDIDIYDPLAVEWALATRFQADRDLVWLGRERGSSLDPSAEPTTHATCKVGFDLTAPIDLARKTFVKVPFPQVDPGQYDVG
jgi:UbiD family decarboxylase